MNGRRFHYLPPAPSGAPPDWALTFADMMSLILVFFILLTSVSNQDLTRYHKLMGSVREAFGGRSSATSAARDTSQAEGNRSESGSKGSEVEKALLELTKRDGPGSPFELVRASDGLRLRVDEGIMFDLGKADLRPEARPFLRRLAPILALSPGTVWVEGHTDDLPIQNQIFPSNWELSAARAGTVVRALTGMGGIPVDRLVAVAYADTRPLAPNTGPEARKRNRRVEFVLFPKASP